MAYDSLESMVAQTFGQISPHENLSVVQAAEKYVFIRQPGSYVGYWSREMAPYLVEPQEVLTSLDYTGMVFVGPARTGKALALDTPIATPSGWTTMGGIKVGDQVFGEDGLPTTVVAASPVMEDRPCYRIVFDDRSEIVADGEHQWSVFNVSKKRTEIVTTEEMRSNLFVSKNSRSRRFRVPTTRPVHQATTDLPLDPYFLGLWLGDGFQDRAALCMNRREGDHIAQRLSEVSGYRVIRSSAPGGGFADRAVVQRIRGRTIAADLRALGVVNAKHIPDAYVRSGIEQRRELLRGMMDSDGSMCRGTNTAVYSTTSAVLILDLFDLLVGLGYKVHFGQYPNPNPKTGVTYRIRFCFDKANDVFSLPCKITKASGGRRKLGQVLNRSIVGIEPVESRPVRCIRVNNPSSLFLAGRCLVPTHNSQMALNLVAHTAKTDPTDTQIIHMTQHTARDWSKRDLAKMLRDSKEIGKLMRPGRQNDNTYDKEFLSGMKLLVNWPTATNLSGKTIRLNWIMDLDRIDDDIDGEGNVFDLTDKRGESFKRFRMTAAESSPNPDKEISDPKWRAKTPHEAPPIKGIFSLYNRGDRRRWYWACPQCHKSFEPSFKLFHYPKSADFMESAEQVSLVCPHCTFPMVPAMKKDLNNGGKWVRDGMIWRPAERDVIQLPGERIIRSDIGSFWMKGPAAIFQDWDKIVLNYLRAEQAYEDTGDELPLRKTVTTDQGDYYIAKARLSERAPEDLKDKSEDWGSTQDDPTVPRGVRFLVATVDVQARSFVVQVQGFTAEGDMVMIDGFKITRSARLNEAGEREMINPAAYPEDWDEITEQVLRRSYPLDDATGRRMSIRATGSDSAGREGFTTNAYAWWRRLRDEGEGLHRRVILVKGDGKPTAPRTAVSWPDQQHKDKNSPVRGDVPVLRLNSNALKDTLNGMLERRVEQAEPGGGMVRYPSWMPEWFYAQMTTEIRTAKGWENPRQRRNESFDLAYYAIAVVIRPPDIGTNAPWVVFRWDRMDWGNPPSWAAEWDENDLVFDPKVAKAMIAPKKVRKSFADLAKDLA